MVDQLLTPLKTTVKVTVSVDTGGRGFLGQLLKS